MARAPKPKPLGCPLCGKPIRGLGLYWANIDGDPEQNAEVGPDCYRRLKRAGKAGIVTEHWGTLVATEFVDEEEEDC